MSEVYLCKKNSIKRCPKTIKVRRYYSSNRWPKIRNNSKTLRIQASSKKGHKEQKDNKLRHQPWVNYAGLRISYKEKTHPSINNYLCPKGHWALKNTTKFKPVRNQASSFLKPNRGTWVGRNVDILSRISHWTTSNADCTATNLSRNWP